MVTISYYVNEGGIGKTAQFEFCLSVPLPALKIFSLFHCTDPLFELTYYTLLVT
jgi:hypothetical protein